MTAVYADFLSNGCEVESFQCGIWEKDCEGPKIPLDKVLAKPVFGDNGARAGSWNRLPRNWLWVDYRGW